MYKFYLIYLINDRFINNIFYNSEPRVMHTLLYKLFLNFNQILHSMFLDGFFQKMSFINYEFPSCI